MGYSITREQHEKILALQAEGRLCQGESRCSTRATKSVTQRSWVHKIGEGAETTHPMVMCSRHAKTYPPGFHGVNFIVDAITDLPRKTR